MAITIADEPTLGVAQRPLRRAARGAILGGVCSGLAVRFGVRARNLRVIFALTTFFGGVGLVAYVALWALVARSGESESNARRLGSLRRELVVVLAQVVLFGALVALVSSAALRGTAVVVASLGISTAGLVVVWRGAAPGERAYLEGLLGAAPGLKSLAAHGRQALLWRVGLGAVLMIVGLDILNRLGGVWSAAVPALVGTAVLLGGLLVLLTPWWLQLVRDLSVERRARVRSEERAALARRVHDSVLQSLTLIERHAGDAGDVRRIARAAERDLRGWLFEPEGPVDPATLSARLRELQDEIERDYHVQVELVSVGDVPVDEGLGALVAAAREALVNAAKWSGSPSVSIYSEVEGDQASIFVRDTGRGFDPATVAPDRQGLASSIRQRVADVGGEARIRSAPGQGTEVALILARDPR